jgi:hypothetical protein
VRPRDSRDFADILKERQDRFRAHYRKKQGSLTREIDRAESEMLVLKGIDERARVATSTGGQDLRLFEDTQALDKKMAKEDKLIQSQYKRKVTPARELYVNPATANLLEKFRIKKFKMPQHAGAASTGNLVLNNDESINP